MVLISQLARRDVGFVNDYEIFLKRLIGCGLREHFIGCAKYLPDTAFLLVLYFSKRAHKNARR
jgi:hypothetical protein